MAFRQPSCLGEFWLKKKNKSRHRVSGRRATDVLDGVQVWAASARACSRARPPGWIHEYIKECPMYIWLPSTVNHGFSFLFEN